MATSWTTFLWAVASIFLMLALAYRNPAVAVLAILPSLLAVGLVVGLMGWLGIKLDIATQYVASVADSGSRSTTPSIAYCNSGGIESTMIPFMKVSSKATRSVGRESCFRAWPWRLWVSRCSG